MQNKAHMNKYVIFVFFLGVGGIKERPGTSTLT